MKKSFSQAFSSENHQNFGEKVHEFLTSEGKLLKIILISSIIILAVCVILYFNYMLIGEFFTSIFLALITALALKPSKDKIVKKLTLHLKNDKYFVSKSILFTILNSILYAIKNIIYFYLKRFILKLFLKTNPEPKNVENNKNDKKSPTRFPDLKSIYYLILICLVYIIIFKIKFFISLALVMIYIILEFVIRILIDVVVIFSRKIDNKFILKDNKPREYVHTVIAMIIIVGALITFVLIIFFGIGLFYLDTKRMYEMVSENNEYLATLKKSLISENLKTYQNTITEQLITLESYLNLHTFTHNNNLTDPTFGKFDFKGGNYTLYDLSNRIINCLNDPVEVVDHFIRTTEQKHDRDTIFIERCEKYRIENKYVFYVTKFFHLHYIEKLLCSIRIIFDQFNINIGTFLTENFLNYFKQSSKLIMNLSKMVVGSILLNIIRFSMDIINMVFLFILYITSTYYFLKSEDDFMNLVLNVLPLEKKIIDDMISKFNKSIQGIFLSQIEIFIYHTTITWILFDIFQIEFVYFFSFSAGIISLIPITSPFITLVPADLYLLYVYNLNLTYAVFLILTLDILYIVIITAVDNNIYEQNVSAHPYITGLSFVMGMYAFGIKGLIFGPLLLCLSLLAYQVFSNLMNKN